LKTARDLISGEGQPTQEELEFALPRIDSIIHKMLSQNFPGTKRKKKPSKSEDFEGFYGDKRDQTADLLNAMRNCQQSKVSKLSKSSK
jgi:hypothetical protein